MTQPQTTQISISDYKALVRRVENLEKIVREQLPISAEPEPEKTATQSKETDVRAAIKEMQEKYAGTTSLTQALLKERAADLEREEAKIRTRRVRNYGAYRKGKGTGTPRRTVSKRKKR